MRIICLTEDTPGHPGCGYEHGLSLYIETKKHKLLFDSGASDLFLRNAETLGLDLTAVDTAVLSHGHYDHSGGLLSLARISPAIKIYLQRSAGDHYCRFTEQGEKYIGIDKRISSLPQCIFTENERKIDDELFLFSKITGTKYRANANLQLKCKKNGFILPDTFAHEQALVITQDRKHILLSGCAHNGILNILDRYYELFQGYPDIAVSGFHMMQKAGYTKEDIEHIKNTALALTQTNTIFYTGHCTGKAAYDIMKHIMGNQLHNIHSGLQIL